MGEALKVCPKCDGTNWEPVIGADGQRRVQRCQCWGTTEITRLLDESGITSGGEMARYAKATLDNFMKPKDNPRFDYVMNQAHAFVANFPTVENGLCFLGPVGIGKTRLAVSIVRAVIEQYRKPAKFYTSTGLLKKIRETYNPNTAHSEMSLLDPVVNAELFVLDDLGSEKPTDWVAETLFYIIDQRYARKRKTIVTSNYSSRSFDPLDADTLDTLEGRVGQRVFSRLNEMCELIDYDGGDYRHMPKTNAGPADLVYLADVRKQFELKQRAARTIKPTPKEPTPKW